jgi:ParB family transcriptional regulator, chromosome partitioning protein
MNLDLSGLDGLLGGDLFAPSGGKKVLDIALEHIDLDREQPRGKLDEAALKELAASIRESGVLQPISVKEHPTVPGRYLVNFGERRVRAARLAGWRTIPALMDAACDPYAKVSENVQREALSPLDLARFIARREQAGDTRAEIARRLGKPRSFISELAVLALAPKTVHAVVEKGRCADVRTLYALARGCEEAVPEVQELLAGDGPIGRAAAEAAVRRTRPGKAETPAKRESTRSKKKSTEGCGTGAREGTCGGLRVRCGSRQGSTCCASRPSADSAQVSFEDGATEDVPLDELQVIAWIAEE